MPGERSLARAHREHTLAAGTSSKAREISPDQLLLRNNSQIPTLQTGRTLVPSSTCFIDGDGIDSSVLPVEFSTAPVEPDRIAEPAKFHPYDLFVREQGSCPVTQPIS